MILNDGEMSVYDFGLDLIESNRWYSIPAQDAKLRRQQITHVVINVLMIGLSLIAFSYLNTSIVKYGLMGFVLILAVIMLALNTKNWLGVLATRKVRIFPDHINVDGQCIDRSQIERLSYVGNFWPYQIQKQAYCFQLKEKVSGIGQDVYFIVDFGRLDSSRVSIKKIAADQFVHLVRDEMRLLV